MIVEAAIVGREIECGVLGGRDGGRRPRLAARRDRGDRRAHAFYDFEAKYLDEAGVTLDLPGRPARRDVRGPVRDVAVARSRPSAARAWPGSTCS